MKGVSLEITIQQDEAVDLRELFGNYDENIKIIQNGLDVSVFSSNKGIMVQGELPNVHKAKEVLLEMSRIIKRKEVLDASTVEYLVFLSKEQKNKPKEINIAQKTIVTTFNGVVIKPKTSGQSRYVRKIQKNTLTFGIGPAGTGKTFLSVAVAASLYKEHQIERIIITRPAIEAGESLGFLPGDLQDKVDPYLRPLFDALQMVFGGENFMRMREKGIIEVAPLAYMRGRTLDDSFIILDEAQNTTINQMKMFLTRFGQNSKVVVNGDITQIDLPKGKLSGLKHAVEILKDIQGIDVAALHTEDVVRNPLVTQIIKRYESGGK